MDDRAASASARGPSQVFSSPLWDLATHRESHMPSPSPDVFKRRPKTQLAYISSLDAPTADS